MKSGGSFKRVAMKEGMRVIWWVAVAIFAGSLLGTVIVYDFHSWTVEKDPDREWVMIVNDSLEIHAVYDIDYLRYFVVENGKSTDAWTYHKIHEDLDDMVSHLQCVYEREKQKKGRWYE